MANALKKIRLRAKQLQKRHPNSKWTSLIKKASSEYRSGKLGAAKKKRKRIPQRGTSVTHLDKLRKAKAPSRRERRKNRTDAPGKLTGLSAGTLKNELKKRLKEKIDRAVLSKYHATKKRIKNKFQKTITSAKAELRKIA